jgi:hypothetical protein
MRKLPFIEFLVVQTGFVCHLARLFAVADRRDVSDRKYRARFVDPESLHLMRQPVLAVFVVLHTGSNVGHVL